MAEMLMPEVAVGDSVRVHFHPPGPMKSFCDGVVSRVDVITPEGRSFVVEVTHEVILDREHRISSGFKDYVRYECRNDFPGRIEILSPTAQEVERKPAPDLMLVEPPETDREADEHHRVELEVPSGPAIEPTPEAQANPEPFQVQAGPQPDRKPRGLIAALFSRRR